jgi:hypothetical protein
LSFPTQEFRGEDGNALPGELNLPLDLFLPLDKRSDNPAGDAVLLSFACRSEFIDQAEDRQRIADATPTPPLRPKRLNILIWENANGDVTVRRYHLRQDV